MLRAASLLIAVLLLIPASANAQPAPYIHLPNETPAPRWVVEVAGKAEDFWAARDVVGCPGIETFQVPDAEILGGWAQGAGGNGDQGCAIWVSDDLVASASFDRFSQSGLRKACHAITHEVGHALGLDHTETGVMSINKEPYPGAWDPWFCRVWARWAVKAELAHDLRFE